MTRKERASLLFAAYVLLAAGFFLVHLPWLRAGLWRDEAVSVYVGSAPGSTEYFARYRQMDYSPPLFDGIVGGWTLLFGRGEGALAVLAGIVSAAALAAGAYAAWQIAGGFAAILAVLFLASNDILFWEFDQVRPYAFSAACACFVLGLFVDRWKRDESRAGLDFAFGIACALLALSHYAGTLAVALLGVVAFVGRRKGTRGEFWRVTALCCAIPAIPLLGWLPAMREQLATGLPWNLPKTPMSRIADLGEISALLLPRFGSSPWSRAIVPALIAAAILLASRERFRAEAERSRAGLGVSALIGVPVLVVFGTAFGAARYASIAAAMASVAIAVLAAAAVRALRGSGRGGIAWIGALLVCGGIAASEAYRYAASGIAQRRPARSGIRAMLPGLRPGPADLIVAAPSYLAPTLWYYGTGGGELRGFPQWDLPEQVDYREFASVASNPNAPAECLRRIAGETSRGRIRRVILVSDLNPLAAVRRGVADLRSGLAARYRPVAQGRFHGYPETIEAAVFEIPGP